MYLPAQHRDLVAEYQEFDIFGSAVAGELGQHLQHWRRSRYTSEALMAPDRCSSRDAHLAQIRTSTRLNPIYEPDTLPKIIA